MSFTLFDEIVLLGLDDNTGKCVSQYANYSFSAALIAELVVRGKVDPGGAVLAVRDPSATGDAILDDAVAAIGSHRRKLANWIRSGLLSEGRDRTLARLVSAGILEHADNKILGLFTVRRFPSHDNAVEDEIRRRLRAVVLRNEAPDERSRMLLSVARGSGLLKTFLSAGEMDANRQRIDLLIAGEAVGESLREVLEQDEAAAAAAVIVASIA